MKMKVLVSTTLIAAFAVMLHTQVKAVTLTASVAPVTYPVTYPKLATSISGKVTYSTKPAANVTITAQKQDSKEVYVAKTNTEGIYTIELTPGTYVVTPKDAYGTVFSPAYRIVRVADYSAQADFTTVALKPVTTGVQVVSLSTK
jgi:hypothetical protein